MLKPFEKQHFKALDAFRGIFSILIVVYHLRISNSITEFIFFRNSHVFVEFFFALSGFVMAHSYYYNKQKITNFLASRFFRLYPLHIFMLLIFLAISLCKYIAYKNGILFNTPPFEGSSSLKELVPNMLLLQSWLPGADNLSFNYPSWSISVEYYVYVIFFMTLIFKKFKGVVWIFFTFMFFILLEKDMFLTTPESTNGLFYFFGGSSIYFVYGLICNKINVNFYMGSVVEILCSLFTILSVRFFCNNLYVMFVIFVLSILVFSFESGFISKVLARNIFQMVGKLSYSIYMTHAALVLALIFLIAIVDKKWGKGFLVIDNGLHLVDIKNSVVANSILIAVVMSAISVSFFTYNFIEIPGKKINPFKSMRSQ